MSIDLGSLLAAISAPSALPSTLRGKVKFLLPAIENALSKGYKYQDISALLEKSGININASQLSAAVRKVRMQNQQGNLNESNGATQTPVIPNRPSQEVNLEKKDTSDLIKEPPPNIPASTTTSVGQGGEYPSVTIDTPVDFSRYEDD